MRTPVSRLSASGLSLELSYYDLLPLLFFYGPCASAFCQAVHQNLRRPCNPCLSPSISVSP